MTTTTAPLSRYASDRRAFRFECRILDNGATYGEAHEGWQEEHVFGPVGEGKHTFLQLPRGHDKTGSIAWCCIDWLIFGQDEEEVIIAAADKDQAGLLLADVERLARRVPWIEQLLVINRNVISCDRRGSKAVVIASDLGSSYGLKPTRLVLEELHAWPGTRAREFFESLWGSIAKRDAQVVVITNAGAGRDWKWDRRELFREMAEQHPERWHFWAPEGWVAEWGADKRDLLAKGMHPLARRRFIENEWTEEAESSFCTVEQAVACLEQYDPLAIERPRFVVQGIDLGLTHDAASVAVVGMSDEGLCRLLSMHVFPGSKESPVLVERVEKVATDNMATWHPEATVFDPWQLASTNQRIGHELRAEQFNFSTRHVRELTDALWQKVSGGLLRFWPGAGAAEQAGEPWDLLRELKQAVVKETSYGNRIDHQAGGYSDRLISVGMAVWRLAQRSLVVPSVFVI